MTSAAQFRALVLDRKGDAAPTIAIRELDQSQLPPDGVLVSVKYSSLNYKDGLILKGLGRLVRTYPHVPGIDLVGTLADDSNKQVVLTGWRVGEIRWGGYATQARVPADWLLPVPDGLLPRQVMAIGTAGLTAALAVNALEERGLTTSSGDVLVTGAAGGVGSVSVMLLSALGYRVVASTGRMALAERLHALGATEIIERATLQGARKPLETERFAAAIDTVGDQSLSGILPQLKYGGTVAACGLAGGADLKTSVVPFLLRGVALLGIDSVLSNNESRQKAWNLLARVLPLELLDKATEVVAMSEIGGYADRILKGDVAGRIVVDPAV
ncbi:MDR family oxidoreductase [Leptospira interrogans]